MSVRDRLLGIYDSYPFERHPYWVAVLSGSLSTEQIVRAEVQHYIRSKRGRELRRKALYAAVGWPALFEQLMHTFIEECYNDATGPSHFDLIERLVTVGGVSAEELESAIPTPANAASMALYTDIGNRGAAHHMVGAGVVEYYYANLSPKIFDAYTTTGGLSKDQAETYSVHGPLDKIHAERALSLADEASERFGYQEIELSVRDAFVATCLHYDGMYHAATGDNTYWNGK